MARSPHCLCGIPYSGDIAENDTARFRLRSAAGFVASARRTGALLALASAVILTSCGYTFGSRSGPLAKASGRPVEVATFRSNVTEADAGVLFSRALAEELTSRGALRGRGAPLVIEGTIERLLFDPVGIAPQGVSTWRAHARVTVVFRDPGGGDSAPAQLHRVTLSEWEEYLGGQDIESTEVSRRMAMSRMFTRLAENAANVLAQ